MEHEARPETNAESRFCPECGSEEEGFFCRNCGALLHGEEMVLCPRCHQVVPEGEFCNQCGQSLSGLALHLRQLAMAGDAFWVTSEATTPSPDAEKVSLEPDKSVELAQPELPDWLEELPTQSAPDEVQSRIYPALQPIEERRGTTQNTSFLVIIILFMLVLMLGLMFLVIFFLMRGGP
ncbi:MAG: zinc ribbon domain-containing protein [Anaerolineae bacterium]|jgi:hypothetical protein